MAVSIVEWKWWMYECSWRFQTCYMFEKPNSKELKGKKLTRMTKIWCGMCAPSQGLLICEGTDHIPTVFKQQVLL